MKVVKSPNDVTARTNCVFLHPQDLTSNYVLVNNIFAFTARPDPSCNRNEIGTTLFHRKFAQLSLMSEVQVSSFAPLDYLVTLNLTVAFLKKQGNTDDYLDTEQMAKLFMKLFNDHIFSIDQVSQVFLNHSLHRFGIINR
jgi:vesicle-fusing ATPase